MIRLDPEEEQDDDDQPLMKTPQKHNMAPPNSSNAMNNDVAMHQHMNNVQINFALPLEAQQNFVSY